MEYFIILIVGFVAGYYVGERYDIMDTLNDAWEWVKEKIIFRFYK